MPRLRITASLSVLALALGVGGTAALTALPRWHDRADVTAAGARTASTRNAMQPVPVPVPRHVHHTATQTKPAPVSASPPRPPPRIVSMPSPRYPMHTVRMRHEGVVTLRVTVNADGHVNAVSVAQSSGYARLDNAASDAVLRARFEASANPPPSFLLPVRFKLSASGTNK